MLSVITVLALGRHNSQNRQTFFISAFSKHYCCDTKSTLTDLFVASKTTTSAFSLSCTYEPDPSAVAESGAVTEVQLWP